MNKPEAGWRREICGDVSMKTMSGGQHAAAARMAPSGSAVELNRTLAYIHRCIQRMDGADLVKSAELIGDLSDGAEGKPLGEMAESELRSFSVICVDKLYEQQPDMLLVVHNFLDALARARAKRIYSQQAKANSAGIAGS